MHKQNIVTIGGGSGTFALLSQLRDYPAHITAIVSTSDSGGSSRRLMDEYRNQLPLGDLRSSLVALARNQGLWRKLFMHRFASGSGKKDIGGHSLGNLMLKALQDINEGDLLTAIKDAEKLLDTAGSVIPVSVEKTEITAILADGSKVVGETNIDTRGEKSKVPLPAIKQIFLTPPDAKACDEAINAILHADTIIIGPGDLYTSILPNLLMQGMTSAIKKSSAKVIYICNLMTKHGETDAYKASDFIAKIEEYLDDSIDKVIMHDGIFPQSLLGQYAQELAFPVIVETDIKKRYNGEIVVAHLTKDVDTIARHDGERLLHNIFT